MKECRYSKTEIVKKLSSSKRNNPY